MPRLRVLFLSFALSSASMIFVVACGLSITGDAGPESGGVLEAGSIDAPPSSNGDAADVSNGEGGTIEAGGDGALPRTGFCANEVAHEVCVDFDDGVFAPLAALTPSLNGATAAVDAQRGLSLPNSYRATGSQVGAQAYLFKSWGSKRSVIDVAFDVWTEGDGYGQIGGLEIFATNVASAYQLLFDTDAGQLRFFEFVNGVQIIHPILATPTAGWHRLDIHVELVESSTLKSRLRVREDKVTYFDGELTFIMPFISNVKADVGLFYSGKTLPVSVFIDNVTIDSRP